MTEVFLEQDGTRYTVQCTGHATGSVETCAAISCLLYTLAGWLENSGCTLLHEQLEAGDALIQFTGGAKAKTAFEMICIGFLQLEEQSEDCMDVEFRTD